MVRGPAATTRLQADPGAEPKLRSLAKGSVPDHGNDAVSDGHREYDYLDRIARRTSHIPEKGAQLVSEEVRGVGPRDAEKENSYLIFGFRRNPLSTIAAPAKAAAM